METFVPQPDLAMPEFLPTSLTQKPSFSSSDSREAITVFLCSPGDNPHLIHAKWLRAIQLAFRSTVKHITNTNHQINTIDVNHWKNLDYYSQHFTIYAKKPSNNQRNPNSQDLTHFYIAHGILTQVSLSEIKRSPSSFKILRYNNCFLSEHHWDETQAYAPYRMRRVNPEGFLHAIGYQNKFLSHQYIVVLENAGPDIFHYVENYIRAVSGVKDIILSQTINTTGKYNIIVDKKNISSIDPI